MTTNNRQSTLCATIAILALPLLCGAQNNSYANMLTFTSTLNNNFTTQQLGYLNNTANSAKAYGAPATPAPQQPSQPQFPITATDFRGLAVRELPARVASAPGVMPKQRVAVEALCYQLLAEYERGNRRNNIAHALTYAALVSYQLDRGRTLTPAEATSVMQFFNNALASSPVFNAMTPDQKQMLYESSILTGGMAATLYKQGVQQHDPAMQMQARQIAQQFLRQWGG